LLAAQQAGKSSHAESQPQKDRSNNSSSTGRVCQVGKSKETFSTTATANRSSKNQDSSEKKVADNNKDFIDRLIDPRIGACSQCGKGAGSCRRCGACTNRWYCGRECQRKDWPMHKQECQTLARLRARCQFSERIGAAYCSEDDDVVATITGKSCWIAAAAAPSRYRTCLLRRLFMGALPGSVFLQTWPTGGRNKTVPIPVYLIDSNNEVLTDVKELLAGYKKLLGRPLPDLAGVVDVAIRRNMLIDDFLALPVDPTDPPVIFRGLSLAARSLPTVYADAHAGRSRV
uniref:MYND-type domain-containing protein n=1 Tax=Macrostomum lignano TaxID=282301 RepID=A0A1I8FU03_9PLAT